MELLIATGNAHKVQEFKKMLEPLGYQVKCLKDYQDLPEIIENGKTFAENAIIKAKTISDYLQVTCIADDSGLVIDGLNGEPGINSARYLGEDTDYGYKNEVILRRLKNNSNRDARFVCVIAYVEYQKEPQIFKGVMEGQIADHASGTNGFGYDPIFFYPPYGKIIATVSDEMKNNVSHRGQATKKLMEFLGEK